MAIIEGDDGSNALEGVADENNEILGFGGEDRLVGANLNDTIRGGDGNDLILPGPGSDTVFGDGGDDVIDLNGSVEGDTNQVSGGEGTDIIYAGAGSDIIDGGDGTDLVSYEFATDAVVVLLGDGIFDFGAAGDILTTVETLFGSEFDDILAGDGGENFINGRAGNDLIAGYGGSDILDGGDGLDLIAFVQGAVRVDLAAGTCSGADADGVAYTGFEGVYASPFDDRVWGDEGGNSLLGHEGNDKLYGRDGNDELTGGFDDDELRGGDGRDSLLGEDGDDRMLGGAGRDRQTGGGGADRFEFRALSDSGRPVSERDTVIDFSRKDGDSILLSRIDADDDRRGNQAFDFIGQDRFGGEAGELRYKKAGDHLTLLGDVDGDGRADFAVDVFGVGRMIAGDFVL